jgi:hypothetical protein
MESIHPKRQKFLSPEPAGHIGRFLMDKMRE